MSIKFFHIKPNPFTLWAYRFFFADINIVCSTIGTSVLYVERKIYLYIFSIFSSFLLFFGEWKVISVLCWLFDRYSIVSGWNWLDGNTNTSHVQPFTRNILLWLTIEYCSHWLDSMKILRFLCCNHFTLDKLWLFCPLQSWHKAFCVRMNFWFCSKLAMIFWNT